MGFVLGGVKIDSLTMGDLHRAIIETVQDRRKMIIFNVNANAIVLAQDNHEFMEALNHANLVFCDGYGVMLASKILGGDIEARITYADWIYPLSALCEAYGMSIFLLGGEEGVASSAAIALHQRYRNLRIAGTHHGYFNQSSSDNQQVINFINNCDPDILLVALGMPNQELWITHNLSHLSARIILPCGACLDYVAGRIRRGPKWMTNHGLEWLARFMIEPQRLWQRYTLGILRFAQIVLEQKLRN
jgi:N-acetylglucosaminyldiphosphoundecaprenol N-acetyl-beta-D-mannosaminyltransferase